ncbi:MAG: radical SAM protein [Chloroflexi bacterium]|nr:radical SAM protein [Chloroflexota bacterium]
MISFGPVPSRRLGQSLGINNIPPKICPYSCVYCQLGRTIKMRVNREQFYDPDELVDDVSSRVEQARKIGEPIDYLTFVPDGEPTLDANLGREIGLLRPLAIPIAVISNASLIWREDVRRDLAEADWVSLKVDAVREDVWRRIDRPHGTLQLDAILKGMIEFAGAFRGELMTETMLVVDLNDSENCVRATADFLGLLRPNRAYLSIPTRPPAEEWVRPPSEEIINRAYQIIGEKVAQVEYLIGYEGNAFAFTGDVEEDLLSITAVHPMRQEAVSEYLARAGAGWPVVHDLVARSRLVEAEYDSRLYYLRKLQ